MKKGRAAWYGNTLCSERGCRLSLSVLAQPGFSADLTCIASPELRLAVVGRVVGLGKSFLKIIVVLFAKGALAFAV